jgi:TorA maturation chaperone TorD
MEAAAATVNLHRTLPPEEAARGDFYALLARLFVAPPDMALLASLAAAEALPADGDAALAKAWRDLVQASSAMDADAAAEEYESLFVGVGKSPVSVYAGFYTGAPAADHPRVRIQAALAALGLSRRDHVTEPEDHFAALLDVMRVLVAGGAGRPPATVAEQRRFFTDHLKLGLRPFFDAVIRAPRANYYRRVAEFGAAFAALETESFVLD